MRKTPKNPTFKEMVKDYIHYCVPICFSIFLDAVFIAVVFFIKSYKYMQTTHNHGFWYYAVVPLNVCFFALAVYSFINLVLLPLLAPKKLAKDRNGDS